MVVAQPAAFHGGGRRRRSFVDAHGAIKPPEHAPVLLRQQRIGLIHTVYQPRGVNGQSAVIISITNRALGGVTQSESLSPHVGNREDQAPPRRASCAGTCVVTNAQCPPRGVNNSQKRRLVLQIELLGLELPHHRILKVPVSVVENILCVSNQKGTQTARGGNQPG